MQKEKIKEINTTEELSAFVKVVQGEIFPTLYEEGIDVKIELFTVVQPYTSGHYLQLSLILDDTNDRILSFSLGENIRQLETGDSRFEVHLATREGLLDVFNGDIQTRRVEEMNDIIAKANSDGRFGGGY